MVAKVGWPLIGSAWRRYQQPAIVGASGSVLVVAALLPLVYLLGQVVASPDALNLLASLRPWWLLVRSLVFSLSITAVTAVIGIPLGFLIARGNWRLRKIILLLHSLPMFLPPFVVALGWFQLLGREGLLGSETTARFLFSGLGLVALLALTFAPVVTCLTVLGVLGVDASIEEAALTVARPGRVALRILLPAARPAIALALIIVFALSLSELGVPMFLRVEVFQAAVFARLGGVSYAPVEAFALVLPLIPLALLLLFVERRLVGTGRLAVTGLQGMRRKPLPLGRWRISVAVASWVLVALALLPIVSLFVRAASGGGFSRLPNWLGQAPWTSLVTAILAALVIAVLGLVLGHAAGRALPGARALDGLAVLSFVMPAPVLGVGIIGVWNRPATTFLYGSIAVLVIGSIARYAVVGIRSVAAVIVQIPRHFEEAAQTTGASFVRRLTRIVLPLDARAVAIGFILALVFCLRDLETAVLYYPPGYETLTVRLFTLEANGPPSVVAALAVTQIVITATVLSIGLALLIRRRVQ